MNEIVKEWDNAAQSYSDFEEKSQYSLYCRDFISSYFSNINDLKILDAGCGNGEHAHILAKNGGIVIGCDASVEMIKIAQRKYPNCRYDLVNLMTEMPYANDEFDIVLCNLVLMDIEPIDNAISEFHRILKKNGILFFSITHPAFYRAEWVRNGNGIISSKKVTGYITPQIEKQNYWGETTHYHRPISYYFNKIANAGFVLNEMFEPKVYEETKMPDIPLYLFAEYRK